MVGAGPRLQLRPHDEGAQKFLTGKAAAVSYTHLDVYKRQV